MHGLISPAKSVCRSGVVESLAILSWGSLQGLSEEELATLGKAIKGCSTEGAFDLAAAALPVSARWDGAMAFDVAPPNKKGDIVRLVDGLRLEPVVPSEALFSSAEFVSNLEQTFLEKRKARVAKAVDEAVKFLRTCESLDDAEAQDKLFNWLKWLRGVVDIETLNKLHTLLTDTTAPGAGKEELAPLADLLVDIKKNRVSSRPVWPGPIVGGVLYRRKQMQATVLEEIVIKELRRLRDPTTDSSSLTAATLSELKTLVGALISANRSWAAVDESFELVRHRLFGKYRLLEQFLDIYGEAEKRLRALDTALSATASTPHLQQLPQTSGTSREYSPQESVRKLLNDCSANIKNRRNALRQAMEADAAFRSSVKRIFG